MNQLILWKEWSQAFFGLRQAFSRQSTYLWATIYCAGLAVRLNNRGVSSIVDALGLKSNAYDSLLRVCHSTAINLDLLIAHWVKLCFRLFQPMCIDGYMVLFGDGIKVGKEGKKMPAVKLMHQSSQSNSKAEYIMGHYLQAISLAVVTPLGRVAAIPLLAKIHDGLVYTNRSNETVIHRFAKIIQEVSDAAKIPAIMVADAYYANRTMIDEMLAIGCHLVSRVAHNTVAYRPAPEPKKRRRGRPTKKGQKILLKSLFGASKCNFGKFYYDSYDLFWPPAKRIIRFVICEHSSKGRIILMSTKLDLDPVTIIKLYEKRWLIETGFKAAVHHIGTFAYHFWMKTMKPNGRKTKQYLHRESEEYREQIKRKMKSYHIHLALSCITQGLLNHLAINFKDQVWASFNGWLRTINDSIEPTEIIASRALASTLPNYLKETKTKDGWSKFLLKNVDYEREGPAAKAA